MNCSEAAELAPLHVAGELEDDVEFLRHLGACEACARRTELSALVWDLARHAPEVPVPDAALRGVYDGIERARRRPQRMFLTLLRLGTVAAAAFLLCRALLPGRAPRQPEVMLMQEEPSGYLEPAFGTLQVRDADAGPLGLRSHSVTVDVRDWVVRTEVEEVFVNASDRRLEGTFVFPLPPDASLSRFAMEVNGALVEGELVERVRAREVYEGIVRRMQDPALLEWMPGNLFKARIFPIEPRSEKRVILAYTQAPRIWNGALSYAYPLVSEKTRTHPPENLSIRASVRLSRPIRRLECPTHRADVSRRDGRSARVTLALRNERPRNDFQFRAEVEPAELEVVSHRPSGEEAYVGVAFSPRFDGAEAPPGTYLFVVDRSARMTEAELKVARQVVDRMIGHLRESDRAGILAHHVETALRAPEFVTADRRREWRDFLGGLRGEGASDVLRALRAAAEAAPEGGAVVYVGKGVPTWGETDGGRVTSEAVQALRGRAFRAVLVGAGANESGLGIVARHRDGGVQAIVPGGDTAAEVEAVARTVAVRPVQEVEASIEGAGLTAVFPSGRPAIYPGERLFLFGRTAATGKRAVVVRGVSAGRRLERRVEVELASGPTEHGALARLWAQRALAERVAECQRRGEPEEDVKSIVAMSRAYQLMTPYTSFLVLESEEAYKQHEIERAKRREEEARHESGQKKRMAEATAGASELELKREVVRRMAHLLELSYMAFDQKRYDRVIKLCDKILLIDPRYIVARELKEDALKTRHKEAYHELLARKVEAWKSLTDDDDGEGVVPYSSTIRFPTREEWAEVSKRLTDSVIRTEGGTGTEPPTGTEWEELLRKLKEHFEVTEQGRAPQADEHYRLAERYYQAGDFEKAELESEKALKLNPNHAAANALRLENQFILGRGKATPQSQEYDKYMKMAVVRHQQGGVELDNAYQKGVRAYNLGDYSDAEREFRKILEYGKWMPTGVELEARQRQARDMLARTAESQRQRVIEGEKARLRMIDEEPVAPAGETRAWRVGSEQARVDITKHVRDGERYMNAKMYDEAIREMERAAAKITEEPSEAMRGLLPQVRDSIVRAKNARIVQERRVEEEKRRTAEAEARPPEVRKPEGIQGIEGHPSPEDREIEGKLRTIKLTIDMRNAPLPAVVEHVREVSGLNFWIDAKAIAEPDRVIVSVKATDLPLGEALRGMLAPKGLGYRVEGGVVRVSTAEALESDVRLELYDIQDLGGRGVLERVRSGVGEDAWDEAKGRSIEFSDGLLVVRTTPELHARVRSILSALREEREGRERIEEAQREIRKKLGELRK